MLKRLSIFLMVLVSLLITIGLVSAQIDAKVDSNGNIKNYKVDRLKPTYLVESDKSILMFNPYSDTPDRLRGIGYTVIETSNPADLNQTNLQNFDALWISVATDPTSYSSQNPDIQAWVYQDGGDLIVTQPSITGAVVSVFPAGFEVYIYNTWWPGNFDATIVNPSHPITQGLIDDDLSGNFDWVRDSDIGASWDILAVDAETPGDVALLAGEYGNGRLVFNTGNFCSISGDPGSDQYLVQMIDWAGSDWGTAYNTLFDGSSDLELLRQYRDKILSKMTKGEMYKTLLYLSSEEALEVFLDNPELMLEAKDLIEANKDAVSEVLNGNEGVIYSTDEIVSFLDAYAKKSPPALEILANMVKSDMLKKQKQGDLFLGFKLK